MDFTQVVGILTAIITITFIAIDAPKRSMSGLWALVGLFGLIGLVIYLVARKPINQSQDQGFTTVNKPQTNEPIVLIPDTCPHCKNPNTKKIRLCEWCGNQIV